MIGTARIETVASPSVRWALAGLSLSMVLASLGTSIANVALPTLAQAFGASFQDVQWVVLAYVVAITALIVGVGRLGDMVGRRRLLIAGMVLFTGASVLSGLAPTLWLLIAGRAAQGAGAAAMLALTLAFVAGTVTKERTGSAMGLLGTMSAIGTALGPSLGGLLIGAFGWRSIFLVNLPLGAAAVMLAWRHLPPDRPMRRDGQPSFDSLGMALLAATLGAYALAMTMGRGQFGTLNIALLLGAAIAAAAFLAVERRAAAPLVRVAMVRDPVLGAGFVNSALVTTVVMATLVVGPFHLSGGLDLDAVQVGLAMSSGPIVAALTGVPAGRVVDRFGARWVTLAGLAAMAVGAAALSVMPIEAGVAGYVAPLVVVTAGYALFQAANNTAVMAGVDADQRGVVSGLLNLARNLGLVTGASAMGAVFAAGGMRVTFAIAACLVGVALVVARKKA